MLHPSESYCLYHSTLCSFVFKDVWKMCLGSVEVGFNIREDQPVAFQALS